MNRNLECSCCFNTNYRNGCWCYYFNTNQARCGSSSSSSSSHHHRHQHPKGAATVVSSLLSS
ncbi:AAEL011064-PA [Aedes aegypti]|uniref:AAEL011064-PA n=1 Tax=Aedes aegypti TaxID=7159 RepID=Q16R64_AEDAE|nr:AAEL011064-PA [Aedes aegypti]